MEQLIYSSIPIDEFKIYCDKFFHASGYSSSLIALNSRVITSSGIHHDNETDRINIVSVINSSKDEKQLEFVHDFANELILFKNENDLWDAASPLIIDDFHIGWICLLDFQLKIDKDDREKKGCKLADIATIHSILDLLIFTLKNLHKSLLYEHLEGNEISILDSNLIPVVIHSEGRIDYINTPGVELLGGKKADNFAGKIIWDFIHPDFLNENYSNSADTDVNPVSNGEIKIIRLDGMFRDVEITAGRILYKGKPANQVLFRDITQRKYTERQLQRSEVWSRALLNAVPDMMFKFSITGIVLDYLPSKGGSYHMPRRQILGQSVYDIFPEDVSGMIVENINECLRIQSPVIFEYSIEEEEIFEGRMVVCGTDEVLLIIRDITDWKVAENQLLESLKEKDMLLMELHHRVKNNLQIVSSLINQQSRYIDDEVSQRAFMETKNRVHSMALIHEKMYQSRDFVHIDFPDYLKMMVHNLFQSYQLSLKVQPEFETEPLLVGIDIAIPCGLIVNELVTNSLKYAFTDVGEGRITIGIYNLPENNVEIMVKDNGKGLPENFNIESMSSLGLTLVKVLTAQLDGELLLEKEGGTTWKIHFSKNQ